MQNINEYIMEKLNLTDLFALHFSDIEKLGINPRPSYSSTPVGIYGYPLRQSWYRYGCLHRYPYASERKFVIIFKIFGNSKIFNLMEKANFRDKKTFRSFFEEENFEKVFGKKLSETDKKFIREIVEKSEINFNDDLYFYSQKILLKFFENQTRSSLYKFFRKILNYDVIIDEGLGRIHVHEPVQLVVLNPKTIENFKIFENKLPK